LDAISLIAGHHQVALRTKGTPEIGSGRPPQALRLAAPGFLREAGGLSAMRWWTERNQGIYAPQQ